MSIKGIVLFVAVRVFLLPIRGRAFSFEGIRRSELERTSTSSVLTRRGMQSKLLAAYRLNACSTCPIGVVATCAHLFSVSKNGSARRANVSLRHPFAGRVPEAHTLASGALRSAGLLHLLQQGFHMADLLTELLL